MRETPILRSRIMRAVKSSDTTPELLVRRVVHRMGYRFRLHRNDLPGKPDLVFPGKRRVIFVHGCFWHGHSCARGARVPKKNRDYWRKKIERNCGRDGRTIAALKNLGWKATVLWECQLRHEKNLQKRLQNFLGRRRVSQG